MIEEQCRGCGRTLLIHHLRGVDVRLEADPLDAQEATRAIFSGAQLWTILPEHDPLPAKRDVLAQLTLAPWARPHVTREHRCVPISGPFAPGSAQEPQSPLRSPQDPPAALSPTTRSDRSTSSPGARSAATPPTETGPVCSTCGRPCDDPATRVVFELGATLIDAFHVDCN